EEADPLADGAVLLDDRAVLDGHQPAPELDEPCAKLAMRLGQRGEMDGQVDGVGHVAVSGAADPGRASSSRAAARATRSRSVSKVSIVPAVSNGTQRTSSNS